MAKANPKIAHSYPKDVERYEGIVTIHHYKRIRIKYLIGPTLKTSPRGWFEILNRDILFVLLPLALLKAI